MGLSIQITAKLMPILFLSKASMKAVDNGTNAWVPIFYKDLDEVPGSWLQCEPALAVETIWSVNKMVSFSHPLPLK